MMLGGTTAKSLRRILAAAVFAAAIVALGAGGPASARPDARHAKTKVSIRLDFAASPHHAGFYVAKAKGYYSQAGLDVSIGEGQGSVTTAQVVASGADTFGFISGDIVARAVAGGAPLIMLGMPVQDSGTAVIVLQSSGITSLSGLQGKTFADTITGLGAQLFPAVLKSAGVDPSSVKVQNIGGFGKFAALWGKRVDAIAAPGFLPSFLSNYGQSPIRTFPYRGAGVPTLGWGIVTKRDMLQSKPGVVRAFVRASIRGFEYAYSHPNEVHAIMTKQIERYQYQDSDDIDAMKLVVQHTANTKGKPLGWMSVKDWGAALRTMRTYASFTTIPSAANLYTNSFLTPAPKKK